VGAHHTSTGICYKWLKKPHAKELEKLAADRRRETEKKATHDVANTPETLDHADQL